MILKADVQGSLEALTEALNKLSTDEIKLKLIHSSTGAVTETDVMLASASDAIILGFKVRPDARVVEIAEKEGVEIKLYDVIYNAINDVRAAMEGLLEPEFKEIVQGRAEGAGDLPHHQGGHRGGLLRDGRQDPRSASGEARARRGWSSTTARSPRSSDSRTTRRKSPPVRSAASASGVQRHPRGGRDRGVCHGADRRKL